MKQNILFQSSHFTLGPTVEQLISFETERKKAQQNFVSARALIFQVLGPG
jgi:hypothetical protein